MRALIKVAVAGVVGLLGIAVAGQWLTAYQHDKQLTAWLAALNSVPGVQAQWHPDANTWLQRDGDLQLTLQPDVVRQLSAGLLQPASATVWQWNIRQQLWPFYISGRAYLDPEVGRYQQLILEHGMAAVPHKLRWHVYGLTQRFDTRFEMSRFQIDAEPGLTVAPLKLALAGSRDRLSLSLDWQGMTPTVAAASWRIAPLRAAADWRLQEGEWQLQQQQGAVEAVSLTSGLQVTQLDWAFQRLPGREHQRQTLALNLACAQCHWPQGEVDIEQLQVQLQLLDLDSSALQALVQGPVQGAMAQWQKLAALQQLAAQGGTLNLPQFTMTFNQGALQLAGKLALQANPAPLLSVPALLSRLEGALELQASDRLLALWPNQTTVQQWQRAGYLQQQDGGWHSALRATAGRVSINGVVLEAQSTK